MSNKAPSAQPRQRCLVVQIETGYRCGLDAGHSGEHTVLSPSNAPWFGLKGDVPAPLASQPQAPLDQLETAAAQLLIEIAFMLPRGTDISKHPISAKLRAFAAAIRADVLAASRPQEPALETPDYCKDCRNCQLKRQLAASEAAILAHEAKRASQREHADLRQRLALAPTVPDDETVSCEGCGKPTADIYITNDEVELCKSCYEEVPVTEHGQGGPFKADQSTRLTPRADLRQRLEEKA